MNTNTYIHGIHDIHDIYDILTITQRMQYAFNLGKFLHQMYHIDLDFPLIQFEQNDKETQNMSNANRTVWSS